MVQPGGQLDHAFAELCCNHDTLAVRLLDPGDKLVEAAFVILVKTHALDFNIIAEHLLFRLVYAFAQFIPIFAFCKRGDQRDEMIVLFQCKGTCYQVRMIVYLF